MRSFIHCLLLLASTAPAFAQEADSLLEQRLNAVLAAEYGHQMNAAYADLFDATSDEDLPQLKNSPHDSIAIQAAWEEVKLTVPRESGKGVYRPDAGSLNRFIGFLEGRGRVLVPDWWAAVVLDARANRRDNIYPGLPGSENAKVDDPYHRAGPDGVRAPHGTAFIETAGRVELRIGDDSVVVPEELVERTDHGDIWCNFSTKLTHDKCYVAIHEDVGYPYTLACLDRATGEIDWRTKAWGTWWADATGRHRGWVIVTLQEGRVVVLGAANTGFHAEAFAANDGTNLFRFSSSYSDQ